MRACLDSIDPTVHGLPDSTQPGQPSSQVKLLGESFAGILVSDRWSGFAWVTDQTSSALLGHLIRD